MKRIPPPLMDFHAFSYWQSVLSLIAMLQTLEMSSEKLSRVFTTLHYYFVNRHFNHIADQREKNSQWMFQLNCTAATCKFCLEVAGLGESLCNILLLCAVRRWFHLAPSSVRITIMTLLLHMSSHAFGNVTLSEAAVARCLHFDYLHA